MSRRWRGAALLLVLSSAVIVSCRTAPAPRPDPLALALASDTVTIETNPPWWNTYVEDVTHTMRMESTSSRAFPYPTQVVHSHTERTIDSTGHWHSVTVTYVEPRQVGSGFGSMTVGGDTIRMEDDGDGAPPRMSNSRGECVSVSTNLPSIVGRDPLSWLGTAMVGSLNLLARLIPVISAQTVLRGRGWVRYMILTDDARDERRVHLLKTRGEPERTTTGRWLFRRTERGRTIEEIVDTTLYAPVEVIVRERDKITDRMTIEYVRSLDGSTTRQRMVLERPAPRRGAAATTMEVLYANVRLEKRNLDSLRSVPCGKRQ